MITTANRYYSTLGAPALMAAVQGKLRHTHKLMQFPVKGIAAPVTLRVPSSDFDVFEQIFKQNEYEFNIAQEPRVIVDAGANIGLASVYFANLYPNCKIVAIEPESTNFELLKINSKPYPNITPIHAALWHEVGEIDLVDPGLGNWGFMTETGSNQPGHSPHRESVRAITVDWILKEFGFAELDILKIDIEGAEKEVFSNTSGWVKQTNALIVELHERMKEGCNRSFYNGSNGFSHEWMVGENVYLSRGNILPRSAKKAK